MQQGVEPFRVRVSRLGAGYLAESEALRISVGGASITDAAEKARQAAMNVFQDVLNAPLPATLFVRIARS